MTSSVNTVGSDGDKIHLPPGLASRSYAAKKSVAEGFLDLALLLANASQLRSVLEVPSDLRTLLFWPVVVMLAVSLLLQVVTGIILFVVGTIDGESDEDEKRITTLTNVSVGLTTAVTVINVCVSGVGMKVTGDLAE